MGELLIGGAHAGWSLERKGVEIPAGTYAITLYDSPHFGRKMPILNDVPGREDILMHWGNYPQNSDGCILVGEMRDMLSGEIFNTRKKFDELFPPIEAAVETEGCSIEVKDSARVIDLTASDI